MGTLTIAGIKAISELRVHDAQNPQCLSCGQIIPPESQAFIAERIAERDALSD